METEIGGRRIPLRNKHDFSTRGCDKKQETFFLRSFFCFDLQQENIQTVGHVNFSFLDMSEGHCHAHPKFRQIVLVSSFIHPFNTTGGILHSPAPFVPVQADHDFIPSRVEFAQKLIIMIIFDFESSLHYFFFVVSMKSKISDSRDRHYREFTDF